MRLYRLWIPSCLCYRSNSTYLIETVQKSVSRFTSFVRRLSFCHCGQTISIRWTWTEFGRPTIHDWSSIGQVHYHLFPSHFRISQVYHQIGFVKRKTARYWQWIGWQIQTASALSNWAHLKVFSSEISLIYAWRSCQYLLSCDLQHSSSRFSPYWK